MPLTLRTAACSLRGNHREHNEDFVAVASWPDAVACVIADGMGGNPHGQQASESAAQEILARLDKPARDRVGADIPAVLREAFRRAAEVVNAIGDTALHPPRSSTVTALFWQRGAEEVHIAHIGDTRAFHLSGNNLKTLTDIHDVRETLIRNGTIPRDQIHRYRIRNVLCRFLGNETDPTPDLLTATIRAGDHFLLASDGVYNYLPESQLLQWLRDSGDPELRAVFLCTQALERGSRDNVSAIVIDVVEPPA